jgi:hypothetical protein
MACAYCLCLLEDELVRFLERRPDPSLIQNLEQVGSRIVFSSPIHREFIVFCFTAQSKGT